MRPATGAAAGDFCGGKVTHRSQGEGGVVPGSGCSFCSSSPPFALIYINHSKTMGKKGSNKQGINFAVGSLSSMTLREESSGKRQISINAKSMLKLEHIRNLAMWAGGEASAPSLGAFFGHRLAAVSETLGSQPDPSLFTCDKCESILQPGQNCTVRIEKNTAKTRGRGKKSNNSPQNYVVYNCHFCSHRNLKRGTPRHHMKTICPPKPKPFPKPKPLIKSVKLDETMIGSIEVRQTGESASVAVDPSTPLVKAGMTLLEAKSKKRTRPKKKVGNSESNITKIEEDKSVGASNRRKRKSWTSLKELAESSENNCCRKLANLSIPFVI